jgi:tetratricopeptide (TPR) repeat protein
LTDVAFHKERPNVVALESAMGALAFAAPLAAYAATLAPTITFGDSGELVVAAAKLGIGHPPGYPLAALAGQLLTLAPFGNAPWKVNLASSLAAAGTCLILFVLLRGLFLSLRPGARVQAAVAAAAAAVAFGFGKIVWSQAVTAEVYAFNALAGAAVLYAGLKFVRDADPRWAYAAAFFGGLALCAHFSSVLVILPTGIYMWMRAKRPPPRRALFLGAAAALAGFFVYLYLPLRAAQGPAINWGDPRTLKAATGHLLRTGMGGVAPARLRFLPYHWWELALSAWREFTPAVLAASAAGVAIALARRLEPWRFLAALALVTGPLATALLVLTLRADQAAEMRVWYIPFFMTAAAFAGLALFMLQTRAAPAARAAGYVAAVGAVALPLAFNFGPNDFREYYFASDYGANQLRTMAYEGVAFLFEKDFGTFEIAFHRSAEGRRPDAEFVSPLVGVLPGFDSPARERRKAVDEAEAAAIENRFEAEFLPLSAGRGIYYNSVRENVLALGYQLNQTGLLYRVAGQRPDLAGPDAAAVWERYQTRGFADVEARPAAQRFREDVWLRRAACTFLIKEALQRFGAGENHKGFAALARAEPIAYGLFEPLANIAGIYLARRRPEKALTLFERAAAAVPRAGVGDEYFRLHYAQILARKGDAYLQLGDAEGAEAAYREAREALPAQPDAVP